MKKATPHIPSHQLPERWFLVDAKDRVLGRLATGIAKLLMGKDMPQFNGAVDAKTNVIVVNAETVKLTGNKLLAKTYSRHSGYPGGLKTRTAQQLIDQHPTRVLEHAVDGMLPKNKLRHVLMNRLKIYAGAEHPHVGQQPKPVNI
ncbi:50S ribosomal protein L13 [candidate division Kazan bacterium RIFCSPHIGHO2_01_FULL_44_14]|uniref:Large ribosomal subunit protein uL13 n=1 Tax=candidate division Kazan bacterium RIFCSPLOWO2_01_FULL_45_19 TaxID=1798538 RepID=A0A1F4NPK7_UNCK3|nr:hypothetical protein [uncultured bacterium]OGB73391.1 MAG: 50S ribosomal protein L13 [candidate division Kazan bacterium RIFCSPLOWO2_01_FULL_45_19]OGB77636.1 MAG: 50S ribosomal protein L13 [candidate division Kazan bacterium RIFCSPHIGHO2_01_FULL_44_14]